MSKEMSKAIVKATPTEGALAAYDYGNDAGVGQTDLGTSGVSIPFINLLQALSPQVAGSDAEVLDGAKPGMFLDTCSGVLMTQVEFVIAYEREVYVEWGNEEAGRGKKIAEHLPESQAVRDAIRAAPKFNDLRVNDHPLIQTFFALGLVLNDPENPSPAILSIASTKIKPFRKYRTARVQLLGGLPPVYAHRLLITSIEDRNSSGQPFRNLKFSPASGNLFTSLIPPVDPIYIAAKALREAYLAGTARTVEAAAGTDDIQF
jgi:hypothetical protein